MMKSKVKTVLVISVVAALGVVGALGVALAALNIYWQNTGDDLAGHEFLATSIGSEFLRPIDKFVDTSDIVVRGAPVSRVTTKKQLPPRYDWEWPENHPLDVPRFMIFDTVQFRVDEYLKGSGPGAISVFDKGTGETESMGLPQLISGQGYVLFLYSTEEGDPFWGDGYFVSGPTQGRWIVTETPTEEEGQIQVTREFLTDSNGEPLQMPLEDLKDEMK